MMKTVKNSYLLMILSLFFMISCSKKEDVLAESESNIVQEETKLMESPIKIEQTLPENEGLKLIETSDCLSCHQMDKKIVGPSYQNVAEKYTESDIDQLAKKIIDGGKGNWGEVAMIPHSGLSKEDAQKMVRYILSLKK